MRQKQRYHICKSKFDIHAGKYWGEGVNALWKSYTTQQILHKYLNLESSPNLCVNSSFSYVVLSTLLLSSRDLTEWSLVYHNTLSYQRFYDLHSIHYDHLEGLHQLI